MDIEFKNVSYSVKTYFNLVGEENTILKNLSGKFPAGQLCAILGSSGAGKTTLLHVLSGYRRKGLSGSLLTNGEERNEKWFRKRSCYITQEDRLPISMTTYEAMTMASRLKLGKKSKQIIEEILNYFGLESAKDVPTELLSGGQKKRLSIALELLANLPVFFLDEPTSGLDDVAAKLTIRLLKRLAAEGRTVICTIHQPSASMLKIFDRIYVMAAGKCVYQGTPNSLVPFLAKIGHECPTLYNPADYIIELVDNNVENINKLTRTIANGKAMEEISFDISTEAVVELNNYNINNTNSKESRLENYQWVKLTRGQTKDDQMKFPISTFTQFNILLGRFLSQLLRNRKTLAIQLLHYMLCAVLVGVCFYGIADRGDMMQNHLKFCLSIVLFFSYTRLLIPIIIYPMEVKQAKKEHFNRWYSLNAYFMATSIAALPIQFVYNFLFTATTYYLFGLPLEIWRFSMYILISNLVAMSTEGLGMAIGAVLHPTLGLITGPGISSVFLGLAIYGFDFASKISFEMELLQRTSPTRLGLSALVIVSFGFDREPMNCPTVFCFFSDPKVLLNWVGGYDDKLYVEIVLLFLLLVLYRVLAYIALQWRFRMY